MIQLVDTASRQPPRQRWRRNHPLRVLAESARTLRRVYGQLSTGQTSTAAACLLDHYSFVRSKIREVRESFSRNYVRKLARFVEENGSGTPRIYRMSFDAVASLSGKLDVRSLAKYFEPRRLGVSLSLAELWAIPLLLKVA